MDNNLDDLYRDILMEHYRFPRGKKPVKNPDMENEGYNPTCGDEIKLSIKTDGGKISDISVDCLGCAISVASGSMLADIVRGKSLDEAVKIADHVKTLLQGGNIPENADLGDLEALRGVNKFPVRIKCALLSWVTMVKAIEIRRSGNKSDQAVSTENL
jgi:nitrogen fixation NifU-like protein